MKNKKHNSLFIIRNSQIGFSLIELLVSVFIFTLVTGIVLVNFPSFSSKIALENLAHEIALAVRQAQVFGIASREFGVGSGVFPGHGIRFERVSDKKFLLYADTDKNKKYTGALELLETFIIRGGSRISAVCGFLTPVSICTPLDMLDIVFVRPDPEPTLTGKVGDVETVYSYVTITIESAQGSTQKVVVWSNGQIAIQ